MSVLSEIKWSFIYKHTYFRVCNGSKTKIGKNVIIRNSRIIVTPGSTLEIGDNVRIENTTISIDKGTCSIADYSLIGNTKELLYLNIESGELHIGHHSKIDVRRIWIRFGGKVNIGNYTNINAGSEIRCDESVTIGDYNQISYNVNIWDTNTHNILPVDERREIAEQYYPYFGKEIKRPSTSPVIIGNDCWIGQNTTILKGSQLNSEVIVGYNCVIAGKTIPYKTTVVTEIKLKLIER